MRFEVPQFIDTEDKIFGPFTWKQSIYLAGGGGICAVSYFALPFIIFVLVGIPSGGLALLLVFYPINDRPFEYFLEAMIYFYKHNRIYYWRKKSTIVYRNKTNEHTSNTLQSTLIQERDINALSRKLKLNALEK